jgi:hypothetical protein
MERAARRCWTPIARIAVAWRRGLEEHVAPDRDRHPVQSVAEELRNLVGRVALGLTPVQHAVVDNMSQVSVGYPQSPMNGQGHGSFRPGLGQRMAPIAGSPPFGEGDTPRFTVLASPLPAVTGLLSSYPRLLNDALGTPLAPNGVWLIRPDGYVAATAPANNLSSISDVLGRISA